VQSQQQEQISGIFTAASHRNNLMQHNRFIGIITCTGQEQFTVMDACSHATFALAGRRTRAAPDLPIFLAGQFHNCAVHYGTTCRASNGPLSTSWIVLELSSCPPA